MKIRSSALAAALLAFSSPAFAALVSDTFDAGDVLLSFYTATGAGATQNLIVNLGAYQQFDDNDGRTFAFSSGIVADLAATYGAAWNTRADLIWAVTGATFTGSVDGLTRNTVFTTSPRATLGSSPIAIPSNTDSALSTSRNQIQSVANAFNTTQTTANSTVSVILSNSNADAFYTRQQGSNTVQFGNSNNNQAAGTTISDLYALVPTVNGIAPAGGAVDESGLVFGRGTNYLGYFTLSGTGLTFTASGTSPVPEPSAFALLGGALALGFATVRRRRRAG